MLGEMFDLVKLHPYMSSWERKIVFTEDEYERLVHRPLPNGSFYKSVAIEICSRIVKELHVQSNRILA